MIYSFAKPVENLIRELMKLPSVGPKSAQRLAFHFIERDKTEIETLCRALRDVKYKLRVCSVCGNLSEEEVCPVCRDSSRDRSMICVVSDVGDLTAIEKAGTYKGLYHVLGGLISPIDGIGPEDLNIDSLKNRVLAGTSELIIATNPTVNGETTALYIARAFSGSGVKITRIAYGLPVGYSLEYADEITLSRAIAGRREI